MNSISTYDKKRTVTGILIGVILMLITAGAVATAFLMVSVMIMGCVKSPPEWVFMIVFIGYPIPLIIASIVIPYLYIKRQRAVWIFVASIAGIFLSSLIFLIWFLFLTRYC